MFSRGLKGDMILGNTLTNLLISKFVFKQMPYIAKFTIFCDFLGPYTIIQFVHYIILLYYYYYYYIILLYYYIVCILYSSLHFYF